MATKGFAVMADIKPDEEDAANNEVGLEFDAPEGFQVPDDATPNTPFEATVGLFLTDSGKLKISTINGIPFEREDAPDNDDDDSDDDEDSDPEAPQSLAQAAQMTRDGVMFQG